MPRSLIRRKLFAKHGVPPSSGPGSGSVTEVLSTDDTVSVANGTTIPDLSVAPVDITVAQGQALVAGNDVVPNRWYRVTDSSANINPGDSILIQGITTSGFDQLATYIDTVQDLRYEAIYILDDTPTDQLMGLRLTSGDTLWDNGGYGYIPTWDFAASSYSAALRYGNTITGGLLSDTWGNNSMSGNILGEATNLVGGGFTPLTLANNIVGNGCTITAAANGAQVVNNFMGSTSSITCAGRISNCYIGEGAQIDDGGFTLTGVIFPAGTIYTATANLTNATFTGNGFRCGTDMLIAEGLLRTFNTKALGILVSANANFSVTVGGTGSINFAGLNNYANNAAAVAAGKAVGDLYYTDTAGEATLKIVI